MNYQRLPGGEASELAEIKETLNELLDVLRARDGEAEDAPPPDQTQSDILEYAKRLLTIRTARRKFLPAGYFDGPALTMLLDLYVSTREDRQVAVSDAVAVSGAPTSTALRWIGTMEADGYVLKRADPRDKRRTLLELTPRAVDQMEKLVSLWRGVA